MKEKNSVNNGLIIHLLLNMKDKHTGKYKF